MKKLILNDPETCVGCNRCIRVCPIEEANIAMRMDSRIVIKIDNEKCIACGACIAACPHGSRDYQDDTERFFHDLASGSKISVLAAPAFKTNFPEWERILTWLKNLGAEKAYDVSLGADICTWAHIRYLQKNSGQQVISQPCPAIVNYILKHNNDLLPYLSPVHSPMLCSGVYMRKYENVRGKIAVLSPCIAKGHEFEDTGVADYNVTFKRLKQYMQDMHVILPSEKSGFDHYASGLGFLYPMPGGLKENVEYYLGKALRIDKSEGQNVVYHALDEYASQPPENLPVVFDVLNCPEGCNIGTGCIHGARNIFQVNTDLNNARQNALEGDGREYLEKLYQRFDETLKLEDFLRRYTAAPVSSINIGDADVEKAFLALGKEDEVSRNFSCGACGSLSCLDMARKIAKGVNIPDNCLEKAHRDISLEHEESLAMQSSNVTNLRQILEDTTVVKQTMEDIVGNMSAVTASIKDFNKMSDDIENIARHINIISLNASIEAARAGKYGRAFGVVAEEIRNLANSSKASVENSEVASANATEAINSISEKIVQTSQTINEFHDHITNITESTLKIVEKNNNIL